MVPRDIPGVTGTPISGGCTHRISPTSVSGHVGSIQLPWHRGIPSTCQNAEIFSMTVCYISRGMEKPHNQNPLAEKCVYYVFSSVHIVWYTRVRKVVKHKLDICCEDRPFLFSTMLFNVFSLGHALF